ncbi:matrix-remodeling-associated protein 5 isoform X2 [Hippopotamus amphibius kiboko]|uniref:matrix-remodeling-associated protein 5 isoform X2 n=1 Tax=Hippopotamus amphibius kiboko TaxID=575201 RepID=UPI00259998F9|nr:matrix-remodeling-associated protein 5 isoform X2 [Hippopotamus amphibius kiboko]
MPCAPRPPVSRLPRDRCPGMTRPDGMPGRAPWRALSVVLILLWGQPPTARACPHPCACYVPSEVHCTFRSLASVPAGISRLVERINLGFNSIQALSETSFAGLTKLELLMIHGNDIPSIPDGALRDLTSLQVFKFSYNKLRVITGETLRGLWSLVRLHVDHNQIEFIHPQAFSGLTSLRLLHLEGNLLHQLHPATFSTFTFLDYFKLSTIRHLYLAENTMRTLPSGMLQNMPLLENLYLHGNPWACDCEMRWFLEWEAKSKGILKCKKDKAYAGGQLCSACSSPRKLQKQELQKLADITCEKPSIESPLRQNGSRSGEEDQDEEEDGDHPFPPEGSPYPTWNVSLNMSDEHGNTVNLVCDIRKPTDVYRLHLNQTDRQEIEINATVALDFECPMTRENYEKLWKLIAYYSEVPVKLHRELTLGKDPRLGYQYRQDADDETLYYTGVRAHILAEPDWVTQPSIDLQLNRRQSTAKTVLLSYSSQHALTLSAKDARPSRSRSWVMIEPGRAVQRAQTVLEGSPCQLSCNVKASESPSISWVLPDGSVLKAPAEDKDGRVSILTSGWLKIRSTQQSDAGLYQCIAWVRDEMDRMVYRVLVQPPVTQPPDGHAVTIQKNPGEPVMLPCKALAVPEAQISWVLPNKRIVNDMANTSHAYVLADGTLSIPKLQGGDSGYYRCVAVNQRGADHLTVGVTVSKKGSARSSKRGRRPGGKTLPRGRGDVVEDAGGSGIGDEDDTSRRVLHPKDQEMFIKAEDDATAGGQKTKKGRRKLKPWKTSETEPETNIAEGRRAFESRRRINVANKQINPERWADILARVRGRKRPKGTEVPQATKASTPPSVSREGTPLLPPAPPPSVSPVQPPAGAEESSGDVSIFGQEEQVSSTVSSTRMVVVPPGPDGVILADPKVTTTHLEEFIDDEFSEKTKPAPPTEVDSNWATAMTLLSIPSESSPSLQALDMVREEPTEERIATEGWSTPDVAYASPLDAVSVAGAETLPYSYRDLETDSQPGENTVKEHTSTRFTPTPAWWVADTRTSEPFEDPTFGDPEVPAQTPLQEQTDSPQLVESGLSAQGHPLTPKGTEENSQTRREGGLLERDPASSGSPESKRHGVESTTPRDSALEAVDSLTASKPPRETTPGALFGKDATTAAMMTSPQKAASPSAPTTHPSRKRPHGRRRPRPQRLRHRHKQTPPTTFAPTDTFSTPPTRVPEVKSPSQAERLLVPASWVDGTVGTPKQMGMEKHAEPVSKGTPRRKHGKRPNKHRYIPSTVSSTVSLPKPSPSPGNKHINPVTPHSEVVLLSATVSLTTGDPHERTRVEDHRATTTETHSSHDKFRETIPVTYKPAPDGKEIKNDGVIYIKDYETDSLVPGGSVTPVASPSGAKVSTVGQFKEASPPGFPGTTRRNPPSPAQPEMLQTDPPVTSSAEALTDSPVLKELEDLGFPSEFSPSATVSTPFQKEEVVPSATLSIIKAEATSRQAETTSRGRSHHETPPAVLRSDIRPQNQVSTPAPGEEPTSSLPPTMSSLPPTTLESLVPTTTKPTPLTSRPSPTSNASKENIFFNYVGTPETKTPSASKEGTQHILKPKELSTPSSNQDKFTFTPKQELGKEAFDGTTKSILPRGPDSHQVFHQPARVPAKPSPPIGTVRPPHTATQSSFKYFVTFQPPRHLTNEPEVTTYPSRVLPEDKHFPTPKLPSSMTTAVPLPTSKPSIPSKSTDQGTDRFTSSSKLFGNNNIPNLRDPVDKLPKPRLPHYPSGRFPFFFNRTLSFPQLAVTPKPQIPTSPAPVTREGKVNPGAYNRIHSKSIFHVDFGPPAPPVVYLPRTTAPPSTNLRNIPLVYSTRSSIPFMTSSAQPSRSFHQSSSKLFSSGGPPASKFWTLGEKPQIITKSPQTVSVTAETDVVFPCEATGKPKPFVTWTKVSTGALMTPNTRVQRFEVLKNGTFVIRNVQVQDRGQYMCTAKNLHGADRMAVLLSVSVQQPQVLASHYKDVTVYLGDTIAMECLAKGTPAPQISWIFPDGRVLHTVSPVEGRITLHENRTLSIKEASFQDRGVYKCVASNAAGADSLAIRLHVAALPPVIQQEKLENISLPPGLSIHVHCTAKAAPLPSVRWVLRDGTQIRPSQFIHGNLFVFPNGTLYIRNLAPKDSGRYECVAANLVGSARRTVQLTVQRAAANARITGSSPHRTDVRYGGTLQLDCSASGDPWPRILWRLPSKRMIDALFSFDTRIKAFVNGTLVVKSVTDKDAGDYLCIARNKVGDDFVALKVNVVMRPAKIEHKEENDHRVFYGGDLKVDCLATGLPNPEISWSLPDGSLVNSFVQSDDSGGRTKRYVVFNNGTLYFNEVGLREEGDYTCFAENQVGKDEMRVRVKVVTEPAAIRNKTYSVVQVPYGDVVTVACEAKGEPTPRVTWLSPTNRLIPTSSEKYQIYEDGTLLIQKAQRSDSGNYTCVVRNSAGEDRKTVWIHVQVRAPKINGNPDAITTVREIAPGGSRKLIDCQAEGIPAPRVLWAFPEGVVLPAPYYGNRITIHRNGTLDIKSLRKSDSVQLTCIGRNEGGEARLVVQLTVLEPVEKPVFHDPVSEKITAMAGHTISLNCSASGSPTPTLLWVLPNGTELPRGHQLQRFYHKGDGMLHVSGLSSVDAGAYRCVARNAAGYSERLVSLKVGLKPETSKQYHNLVTILNGETLQLPCTPVGARQTRASWTLPSGVLLEGPQARGRLVLWENGTLTVRDASVFDRGTYVCRADTEYGPSVVTVPVIVIAYPPRITSEPTPVIYVRPGGTVKLNCMAMGIPRAEVTWELPGGSRLTAGTQPRVYGNRSLHPQGSLTIQQATQRDAGFYKCTAKNLLGSDSKATYIHVY